MSKVGRPRKKQSDRLADVHSRSVRRGAHLLNFSLPSDYDPDEMVKRLLLQPEMEERDQLNLILPVTAVQRKLRSGTDCQISLDVPALMTKALQLFIGEISLRAHLAIQVEDPGKKRIKPEDLTAGISSTTKFDFLRDVFPEDELTTILKMQRKSS